MTQRILLALLSGAVALSLSAACGDDGANNDGANNGATNNATNNGGPTGPTTPVANLSEEERLELCAELLTPAADVEDDSCITAVSAEDCAAHLASLPDCVTVENARSCGPHSAGAICPDAPALTDCRGALTGACEAVDGAASVADLSADQRSALCAELTWQAGGPGVEKSCAGPDDVQVPTVAACAAKLADLPACATVDELRGCFADAQTCPGADTDGACYFLEGDSCEAPVLGTERIPVGFNTLPPVPVSCDDPGAIQRLPFIFTSSDFPPIVEGDLVYGRPVWANQTLDASAIHPRRTRLSVDRTSTCETHDDCPDDFSCATAGLPGATKQCTRQTGVTTVPSTFRADYAPGILEEDEQLVAVLIENTTSLDGGPLDIAVSNLFRETTTSCTTDEECGNYNRCHEGFCWVTGAGRDLDRASDPDFTYKEALKTFLINLASAASPLNTQVGLWSYGGDAPARATSLLADDEDLFTNDLSVGENLIDAMPNPLPRPANLWQSILRVIDKGFDQDGFEDHEKFLFVFTDGPNEVYDADATYAEVLDKVSQFGVRIFIVHLDSPVDPSNVRDLPSYYAGTTQCRTDASCTGARACTSDADCENFESCRPATIYADDPADGMSETPQPYCLPSYDETGRLGPFDIYADLACRSGGNYIYLTEPGEMLPYWRILASAPDGQFSAEFDFSALSDADVVDGFYQLSGVFMGSLGGADLPAALTAPIPPLRPYDNRHTIRLGRVKNP